MRSRIRWTHPGCLHGIDAVKAPTFFPSGVPCHSPEECLADAERIESVVYFTADILQVPDTDRGCRTQITVKIDGDAEKLWQNGSHGLRRSAVYGDLTADLKRFCRFKDLKLIHEA